MTEDEAKTKVCCGPLHQPEYAKVGDIAESRPSIRNCVGSACMAWRWKNAENWNGKGDAPRNNMNGHCGLAGQP